MLSSFRKRFIREIRYHIFFSVAVLAASIYLGYEFASSAPDRAKEMINEFKEIIGPVKDIRSVDLFLLIFFRNSLASAVAFVFGAVFGILPLVSLFANGAMVGVLYYFFSGKSKLIIVFLAGILPHGIIEIPAFIFSTAIGFWIADAAFRRIMFGERRLRTKIKRAFKFYFFTILPMLLLAAVIEVFITPRILSLFGGYAH